MSSIIFSPHSPNKMHNKYIHTHSVSQFETYTLSSLHVMSYYSPIFFKLQGYSFFLSISASLVNQLVCPCLSAPKPAFSMFSFAWCCCNAKNYETISDKWSLLHTSQHVSYCQLYSLSASIYIPLLCQLKPL